MKAFDDLISEMVRELKANDPAKAFETKKIEIKPQVGDEYPDYLRKMRMDGSEFILIKTFVVRSITRERFVEYFADAGKPVIFLADVEKRMWVMKKKESK